MDSIEQPNSWPQSHVVKSDGTLSSRSPSAPRCQEDGGVLRYDTQPSAIVCPRREWKVHTAGRDRAGEGHPATKAHGGNLVGMDNRRGVTLFDTTGPLRVAGQAKLEGCLWFNLENAVDNNGGGIWLPLGQYGAARNRLGGLILPSQSSSRGTARHQHRPAALVRPKKCGDAHVFVASLVYRPGTR